MLGKIKSVVYELLREDSKYTKANIIIDYILSIAICLNVILVIYKRLRT